MANYWLKKNPFMSMWLSAANSIAGSMRGQAIAQTRQAVNAAVKESIAPPVSSVKANARTRAGAKVANKRKR